jgi:hypothetical protein
MNISVTSSVTSAKRIGGPVLIQNLGPGKLYVSFANTVATDASIQLDVFDAIEVPGARAGYVYFVADSIADVRLLGGADVNVQGPIIPPPVKEILLSNVLDYTTQGQVAIAVSLSEPATQDVTVTFTTAATTTSDPDYSGEFGNTSVTIPAGETNKVLSKSVFNSFSGDEEFPYDVTWVSSSANTDWDGLSGSHIGPRFLSASPFAQVAFPPGLIEAGSYDISFNFIVPTTDDITITGGTAKVVSGPYAASQDVLLDGDNRVTINAGHVIPAGTSGGYTIPNLFTVADDGIDQTTEYDWLWYQINATSTDQHVSDGVFVAQSGAVYDNPVLVADFFGAGFTGVSAVAPAILSGFPFPGSTLFPVALGFTLPSVSGGPADTTEVYVGGELDSTTPNGLTAPPLFVQIATHASAGLGTAIDTDLRFTKSAANTWDITIEEFNPSPNPPVAVGTVVFDPSTGAIASGGEHTLTSTHVPSLGGNTVLLKLDRAVAPLVESAVDRGYVAAQHGDNGFDGLNRALVRVSFVEGYNYTQGREVEYGTDISFSEANFALVWLEGTEASTTNTQFTNVNGAEMDFTFKAEVVYTSDGDREGDVDIFSGSFE